MLRILEENKSKGSGGKENLARDARRETRSSKIVNEERWRIESGWWIRVTRIRSDQIVGGIDDGDGKLVGCGKRRIVSWIKWYPSLPVSSPCRSFSLLHPPRSGSRFDSASFSLRFSRVLLFLSVDAT